VTTRILSALKKTRTPMAPKAIREAIRRDPTTTREAVKRLEAEGRVVVTGTTATRRVALA
jgi:DNA-binding MarR family transcriptional regulator